MKKEDQRIKVTKMLIRKALSKLLKEKSFEKISIKELCDLASINRGTFYSHYKDLNDLQNQIYKEFLVSFKGSFDASFKNPNTSTLTTESLIASILTYIKEYKDICIIMLHGNNNRVFLASLNEIGKSIVESVYPKLFEIANQNDLDVFYSFVSGGAIKLILEWLDRNCDMDVNELSIKLNLLIKSTINYFNK